MVSIVVGGRPRPALGAHQSPADLEILLDVMRGTRPDGATVLVAASTHGLEIARSARTALGDPTVGVIDCRGPATRVFLAAAAIATLPAMALGLAPVVVDAVGRATTTRALLSSVAGLTNPRPTLWQDARSYLPGGSFVVDWSARSVAAGAALGLPAGSATVVNRSVKPIASDELPASHEHVDLEPDGDFWGAKRWLEVSVVGPPLDDVVDRALAPDAVAATRECLSCGRLAAGPVCLFCQIPVTPRAEPAFGGVG